MYSKISHGTVRKASADRPTHVRTEPHYASMRFSLSFVAFRLDFDSYALATPRSGERELHALLWVQVALLPSKP